MIGSPSTASCCLLSSACWDLLNTDLFEQWHPNCSTVSLGICKNYMSLYQQSALLFKSNKSKYFFRCLITSFLVDYLCDVDTGKKVLFFCSIFLWSKTNHSNCNARLFSLDCLCKYVFARELKILYCSAF